MGVIDPTFKRIGKTNIRPAVWVLSNGDTGKPVQLQKYPDKTAQIFGDDFGGGTGKFVGTIDERGDPEHEDHDNAVWFDLVDVFDATINATSNMSGKVIAATPVWVRPELDGGTGGSVKFVLGSVRMKVAG